MSNKKMMLLVVALFVVMLTLGGCGGGNGGGGSGLGTTGGGTAGDRPTNPAITFERAIEIAQDDLNNQGIPAAFRTHSGMSWERQQWVWELEFTPTQGSGIIEYYINVHTGAIVKFEWEGSGTGGGTAGNRPTNPAISLERAIEIAQVDLNRRGISAAFRTHSGMSWERQQWVWELEFRPTQARGVIEYYINVHTGAIVKFEWDR